ncbi:hypothetical protein EDD36DRAFT_121138 [Exophiala viscosa]|uniref:Uncharacterized protein n=1 Tax=Exophiala viscosa TaxID=2486360 RepID=A0AAN6E2Q7_9EURO|nr:hypothetical protein EDD36DRAFT_121138 [Exophiala viscosa]
MTWSDGLALSVGGAAYTMRSRSAGEIGFDTTKHIDDPLITVPVLGPQEIARRASPQPRDGSQPSANVSDAEKSKSEFSLFARMKLSVPDSSVDFVMCQVPRSQYLAHYAKDENGRYIGSGEPAEDCILSEEDMVKYRGENALLKPNYEKEVGVFEGEIRQPEMQQHEDDGVGSRILEMGQPTAAKTSKMGGLFKSFRGSSAEDGIIR